MTPASFAQTGNTFQSATRIQQSLLAPFERKCLHWLAARMPRQINSDHLTLLGLAAMFLAGATYALARWWPPALLAVGGWLAVNWFGDSLDGTLARVRKCQRPRYGFYVDHIVDTFGALFLLAGLGFSGYMAGSVAVAMLIAFYLLSINTYLATYTLGTFQLSFWKFSPTELRILLAAGNVAAFFRPTVRLWGLSYRFFDVAGTIGTVCMTVVFAAGVIQNTRELYARERPLTER